MDTERFFEIINNFAEVRIAVVGDLFLDRIFYINRKWDEPSLETGLTAYQVSSKKCVPGAAGVITNNLSALKIKKIYAIGLLSDDGEGFDLKKGLEDTNVNTDYMVLTNECFTPTYTKTIFVDEETGKMEETHRIDIKNRKPIPEGVQKRIIENLLELENKVDAIVCLEQLENGTYGVFSDQIIEVLAEIGRRGKTRVFIDSRFNIQSFRDVIIKCNEYELLRTVGMENIDTEEEHLALVEKAMKIVRGRSSKMMFISCGENGIKVFNGEEILTVPGFRVDGEIDICGAGDSALSGIACAMCAGADAAEAALIGNLVASLIIQQIGVTGIATREMLINRFYEYNERR